MRDATTVRFMVVGLVASIVIMIAATIRVTTGSLAAPREVVPLDCTAYNLKLVRTQIAEHLRREALDDSPPGSPLPAVSARRAAQHREHLAACAAPTEVALCFGFDPRRAETDLELLTGYQPIHQEQQPDWRRKVRYVRGELALCGGAK